MSQIFAPIGTGNLAFDCTVWSNQLQRRAAICIRVNVASLTALNAALRAAGKGEYRVSNWQLFTPMGNSEAIAA